MSPPNPPTAAEWARKVWVERVGADDIEQEYVDDLAADFDAFARQEVEAALAQCGKESCIGWKLAGYTNWVTEEAAQARVEPFRERAGTRRPFSFPIFPGTPGADKFALSDGRRHG